MFTDTSRSGVIEKAALLCVAADIHACRNNCVFFSHAAAMGCNKCYIQFG